LFDRLDRPSARRGVRAAERLVREADPDVWFAAYEIASGERPLSEMTLDRRALVSAIGELTDRPGTAPDTPVGHERLAPEGPSATATEQAFRRLAEQARDPMRPLEPGEVDGRILFFWDRARRVEDSLGSLGPLLAVVRGLGALPGRKAIVFFSMGLAASGSRGAALLGEVISAANRGNVSVYSVDARGLSLARPDREADAALSAAAFGAVGPDLPDLMEDVVSASPASSLRLLATSTGGLAIAGTERIAERLVRLSEDLAHYHEVTYVPPRAEADGRFRRIAVRLTRPGLTVRTRNGYYAAPNAESGEATDTALLAALAQTPPRRDVRHRSALLSFAAQGSKREAVAIVEVAPDDVRPTPGDAEPVREARFATLLQLRDERGRVVARMSQSGPIDVRFDDLGPRRVGRTGFRRTLQLSPGRYSLETAVRDLAADRLGVEVAQVEVPRAEDLPCGPLVLVERSETLDSGVGADPLTFGRVRLTPALGPFAVGPDETTVDYFISIYPSLGSRPVSARLEVFAPEGLMAHASPSLPPPDETGRIAYLGRLPVGSLPPGSYRLVLTLKQGDSQTVRSAHFELSRSAARAEPGAPPVIGPSDQPAAIATAAPPAGEGPELAMILARAATYVAEYARDFRNLVTEESYSQSYTEAEAPDGGGGWGAPFDTNEPDPAPRTFRAQRRTRADLVFVRLPGTISWGSLRDVFEVDGQPVRDRDRRLERLLSLDPGDPRERARAILEESARYNIGSARRNLNIPTLALSFLDRANQPRFSFRWAGRARVGDLSAVELRFREVARPSILKEDHSRDLPVEGSFWVDPARGAVLRSTMRFRFPSARGGGRVTTEYRREEALGMWVPSLMEEEYEDVRPGASAAVHRTTRALARYSAFRTFTVTIEGEEARLPSPEPEGGAAPLTATPPP
jgi:VWFA-related protein